jgi:hypothetical protein
MVDKIKMKMTDMIIIKTWTINTLPHQLRDINNFSGTENTAFPL